MPPKSQKLALTAVFLTISAFALPYATIPPLTTTIADEMQFHWESFGYFFMVTYLAYAVAGIVGGRLHTRFGITERTLVAVGVFALALIFAAGTLVSSFLWLILWAIPLGLAAGLTQTFSAIMVARSGGANSTKLVNFSQMFLCLSAIAAPYFIAIMLAAHVHWRFIFLIVSSLVVLVAVFFTAATGTFTAAPASPSNPATPPTTHSHSNRAFILMAAAMFLYVGLECSAAIWLAAYFQHTFALSPDSAAWRPGLFWISMILGRALILILPDRWTVWRPAIIGPIGMISGAVLIACSPSPFTASAAVLLFALSAGPLWPVIVAIGHNYRNSTRFTAGIIAFGSLGAALCPLLASWLIRFGDLSLLFPAIALGSVVLLLTTLAAKKTITRQAKS